MIKELSGLKCRALAVELSTLITEYKMINNELWILNGNYPHKISLPKGNWKIIGRADELYVNNMAQLLNTGKESANATIREWQSYCIANSLSNQLILIEIN